ncbi:MAG: glycoside hydrolase family 5 protein [Herbinix sp.]|jgi:hypothetical protein|nr:glycoside hydrolase family 5 protein [Herbinix sp.]
MDFIKANSTKLIKENGEEVFLKGFGLGGWLLPEGYMWKLHGSYDRPRRMEQLVSELCGKEYNELFWKKYRESYITKWDIEFIASKGFNCVRLPMNSRILYKKEGTRIMFVPEEIKRLDEFLCWCEECDIYVILDMHGAPGGQTGTNIDDCENDEPELFMEEENQETLCFLWGMIAERYASKACIAGYDLLNEPLPNWFSKYNDMVMPLYRKIASSIRKHDSKHMLILEGVYWATDFSIFDELLYHPFDFNIMLQFHKYWNCPDVDSINTFLAVRDKLQVPLLMGEGGENNLQWYVGLFSMLRKENISYSFWSYKKMDTLNSPISFEVPKNWHKIMEYDNEKGNMDPQEAIEIFNNLLINILKVSINEAVIASIESRAPLLIPAEFYSDCSIKEKKQYWIALRKSEPVTILYVNDLKETKEPDYKRYGGEKQPDEETLCIALNKKDLITYEFFTEEANEWELSLCLKRHDNEQENKITVLIDKKEINVVPTNNWQEVSLGTVWLEKGRHVIKLMTVGKVLVDNINITYPKL